jgi:hypothetical protein
MLFCSRLRTAVEAPNRRSVFLVVPVGGVRHLADRMADTVLLHARQSASRTIYSSISDFGRLNARAAATAESKRDMPCPSVCSATDVKYGKHLDNGILALGAAVATRKKVMSHTSNARSTLMASRVGGSTLTSAASDAAVLSGCATCRRETEHDDD